MRQSSTAGSQASSSRRFFLQAALLAATEITLRLKGLVLLPLLTRQFGAVNYGVWAQVATVVTVLSPAIMLGLDSAVARFIPGKPAAEQRAQFTAYVVYIAVASVLVGAVMWAAAPYLAVAFFDDRANSNLVALAGASLVTSLGTTAARLYFRIKGQAKLYSGTTIAQSILSTAVTLVVIVSGGGVMRVVALGVATDAFLLVCFFAFIVRTGGIARPDMKSLGPLLRFGVVIVPAGYAFSAINWTDRLLLLHLSGLEAVGVYAVAWSLGYLVIGVFFNPIWVMYPTLAAELYNKGDLLGLTRITRQSISLAAALVIPVIAGWFVLSRNIVSIVASSDFAAGAPAIPLIAAGYAMHMFASYFDTSLGLRYKQGWSTVAVTAAMVVNVVLNLVLIPQFGLTGAAMAIVSAFATQLAIVYIVSARIASVSIDGRVIGKILISAVLMAAVVLLLPGDGLAGTALRIVCGAALYGVALVLLRAVKVKEISRMLRRPAVLRPPDGPGA